MGGYKMKLARSFSTLEPQKLRLGVLTGCFLVTLTYFSMTKPFMIPLPTMNSRLSSSTNAEAPLIPLLENMTTSISLEIEPAQDDIKPRCNSSDPLSYLCVKLDAITLKTNSTTTYEAPPSIAKHVNDAPQFDIESGSIKEGMHDGFKSLHDAPSKEHDAKNTTELESDANTKEGSPLHDNSIAQGLVHHQMDGEIRILKNSSSSFPSSVATHSIMKVDTIAPKQLDVKSKATRPESKIDCDLTDRRSAVCEMEGDIRIIGTNSSVIYVDSSLTSNSAKNQSWLIRPYARKSDSVAMQNVRTVTVASSGGDGAPICAVNHNIPAIVFSIAGYTGNYFHDFTDVLVPLFLTTRQFDGEVQFLVTNYRSWWINKYRPIFKMLTRYEIINYDSNANVHCFSHVIVGLRSHKDLSINPSRLPFGHSMFEFTKFMRSTYSLERDRPMRIGEDPKKKPRLLIIARRRTRKFTNLDKIVRMSEKLGFEVLVAESDGGDISQFARVVNSCDVMMGVHGAGLTNLVFLPPSAILIQIVPWGNLQWIASTYFKEPSKEMKLRYLEYSIQEEESTLIEQYPKDHPVMRDPSSLHRLGWDSLREIYLVKQNVKLNVKRFRQVLAKALKLLHQ